MSDLDPIITTAKAATSSIKSAIQSGREISSAVESIQNFGMAEVKARHAFKTVRSSKEGEITIMTAMSEWRRLDQIRRMELEVRDFLVKQFGEEKGLEEFEKIKKIKEILSLLQMKLKKLLILLLSKRRIVITLNHNKQQKLVILQEIKFPKVLFNKKNLKFAPQVA